MSLLILLRSVAYYSCARVAERWSICSHQYRVRYRHKPLECPLNIKIESYQNVFGTHVETKADDTVFLLPRTVLLRKRRQWPAVGIGIWEL